MCEVRIKMATNSTWMQTRLGWEKMWQITGW